MCKVFAMTNVSNVKVNTKLLSIIRNEVCRHADQDGFGYAVLSSKGEIGGERTIRPLNFRPLINPDAPKVVESLPIVLKANNGFGIIDATNAKSLIAHGRLSTNTVTLENTHPFTNGEIALIHNGVVNDPTSTLKNLTSTCDSEILMRYWERGGVEDIEKMVSGYYAVAVLDKHGILHIMRDDRADLFISYCRSVDSFMIATTAEIIRNVAKEMKWKIEHPEEILEKTYTAFDGNEIIAHRSIVPRSSSYGTGTNYYQGGSSTTSRYANDYANSQFNQGQRATIPIKLPGNGTPASSVSEYPNRSAWDGYEGNYSESNADDEPIPKYKELLPGGVARTSSTSTTATTSADTIDRTDLEHSGLVASLVDGINDDSDPDLDQRVEMIVSEVEDWRSRRPTGSDV